MVNKKCVVLNNYGGDCFMCDHVQQQHSSKGCMQEVHCDLLCY